MSHRLTLLRRFVVFFTPHGLADHKRLDKTIAQHTWTPPCQSRRMLCGTSQQTFEGVSGLERTKASHMTDVPLRPAARPTHFQANQWLVGGQQRELEVRGRKTVDAATQPPNRAAQRTALACKSPAPRPPDSEPPDFIPSSQRPRTPSLHRHALGQVARLVDVGALGQCRVVGQ